MTHHGEQYTRARIEGESATYCGTCGVKVTEPGEHRCPNCGATVLETSVTGQDIDAMLAKVRVLKR